MMHSYIYKEINAMSEDNKQELKKQTITFTAEGHAKLKDMSKRFRVSMWKMIDILGKTADEKNPEFLAMIEEAIEAKGSSRAVSKEIAAAVSDVTRGLNPAQVKELLERARNL